MRYLILLILAVTLYPSYADPGSSDNALSEKIVGVWSATYENQKNRIYGETFYKRDGTNEGRGEVCLNGDCNIIEFTGTWKIENGILISVVISGNSNKHVPGTIYRDTINSITNDTLVMFSEKGIKQIRRKVEHPRFVNNDT